MLSCIESTCRHCEKKTNDLSTRSVIVGRVRFRQWRESLLLFSAVMLVMFGTTALGDDTQALQDTLASLCSLNKVGRFASCCEKYDVSSVTLASSTARNCYIDFLGSTHGSILTSLFVFPFPALTNY